MDDVLYPGQDYTVELDTLIDLTDMALTEIHYLKPNSETVVRVGASVINETVLTLDISRSINDTCGDWIFRSYAEATDGKVHKGEFTKITIYNDIFM